MSINMEVDVIFFAIFETKNTCVFFQLSMEKKIKFFYCDTILRLHLY